jgi:hypothetical protein
MVKPELELPCVLVLVLIRAKNLRQGQFCRLHHRILLYQQKVYCLAVPSLAVTPLIKAAVHADLCVKPGCRHPYDRHSIVAYKLSTYGGFYGKN